MAIDGGKVLGRELCRHNTGINTLNRQEPGFLVLPVDCFPDCPVGVEVWFSWQSSGN